MVFRDESLKAEKTVKFALLCRKHEIWKMLLGILFIAI